MVLAQYVYQQCVNVKPSNPRTEPTGPDRRPDNDDEYVLRGARCGAALHDDDDYK